MRLIVLAFIGFIISAVFLAPRMSAQFNLPEEFYLYAPLALMVIAMVCQLEGFFTFRKLAKAKKISEENDVLEQELSEVTEKLHHEKKRATDFKTRATTKEKELRVLKKQWQGWEESAERKEDKFLNEKSALEVAISDLRKQLEESEKEKLASPELPSSNSDGSDKVLQFLGLLQERGRFVDFLMDDVSQYQDEEVGAAARVIHSGCKQVFQEYFEIEPVRSEDEGSQIELESEYNSLTHRLLGEIGEPPYKGTVLHRGWRTDKVNLPLLSSSSSDSIDRLLVISPAEVELS